MSNATVKSSSCYNQNNSLLAVINASMMPPGVVQCYSTNQYHQSISHQLITSSAHKNPYITLLRVISS